MGVHFFLWGGRFVFWYWKRKAWKWWIRLLGEKNRVECCRKGTFFLMEKKKKNRHKIFFWTGLEWAWFCIAFYLVSCRFSDRWRGRFKQPSRGRPSRPSRSMENLRWGLEIRPCTVSLSTPSVESARELAPSLSARRRTSGGRCARIPLTWGGASTS